MKLFCTGGTGYLGRGVLRRDLNYDITIYSRDEYKQDICQSRYPNARYVLGDIRDTERLSLAMAGHDIVIHTAAVKFVDKAETNAAECLSVNVGGSESVILAARRAKVQKVVSISSDKAVQPVNTYGCSKMAMERLFSEASDGFTLFNCVRYGNVIGSTGSVIPLFRRQYEQYGKVTITDSNMTRFWMSVDEAIDLILLALNSDIPGAVFIPLVKSMKMGDVVKAALPYDIGEVPAEIIGIRPGEKMHERLLHDEESVRAEKNKDHFVLYPPGSPIINTESFNISSKYPHFWLDIPSMRSLIADSELV